MYNTKGLGYEFLQLTLGHPLTENTYSIQSSNERKGVEVPIPRSSVGSVEN